MKIYKLIIILTLLIGCKEKNKSENSFVEKKPDLKIEKTSDSVITPLINKTTESQFPEWLNKIYLEVEESEINEYRQLSYEIERFRKINDSVTFCIYTENDITCSRNFLATQLNKVEIDNIEISESCDRDLSMPNYDWSEYKVVDKTTFEKTEYFEFVPDSLLLDDGRMEVGKSIEDYETVKKEIHYEIKILESGKINKKMLTLYNKT